MSVRHLWLRLPRPLDSVPMTRHGRFPPRPEVKTEPLRSSEMPGALRNVGHGNRRRDRSRQASVHTRKKNRRLQD